MKKNIIIITLLIVCTAAIAQKKVFWLHGLNGNLGEHTWDVYKPFFTSRQGSIVRYRSDTGIKEIARQINDTNLQIAPGNEIILVGHSMGGLVCRSIQQINPNIKGIIAAGTPNNGAPLLKNVRAIGVMPLVKDVISSANSAVDASLTAVAFCAPPVSTLSAPLVALVYTFKSLIVTGGLIYLDYETDKQLNDFIADIACINDMMPGSKYLQSINSQYITTPIINIYGVEDAWQLVRIAGSLRHHQELKKPANMDIVYDEEFIPLINKALSLTTEICATHKKVYNALLYAAIIRPWIWATRETIPPARKKWTNLHRLIETDLHNNFSNMMEAYKYELHTYCTYEFPNVNLDNDFAERNTNNITKPPQNRTPYPVENCYTRYIRIPDEHDGIVSAKQVIIPEHKGVKVWNVRAKGVNHQEMGNHPIMREIFYNAFNEKDIYENTFYLGNH